MKRIDVTQYREQYLREVEDRIIAKKASIPNFTSKNLNDALLTELNRADEETWEVEIPEDREQAIKEAEQRIIETMKRNVDLGVGKSY